MSVDAGCNERIPPTASSRMPASRPPEMDVESVSAPGRRCDLNTNARTRRWPPLGGSPRLQVVEIIDLMTENRIGAVPVVDNDSQLAGIVSYVDVLRAAGKVLAQPEPLLTS